MRFWGDSKLPKDLIPEFIIILSVSRLAYCSVTLRGLLSTSMTEIKSTPWQTSEIRIQRSN